MKSEYEIYLEGHAVGKAELIREGLYYRVKCLCRLAEKRMYRILLKCDETIIDLGICVPVCNGFGLETRVAAKNLCCDNCEFLVTEKRMHESSIQIALTAGNSFAYLDKLNEATYRISNCQSYIEFRKQNA